jgi:hypothetical protein
MLDWVNRVLALLAICGTLALGYWRPRGVFQWLSGTSQ